MNKLFYPLAIPIFCLCYWYATEDDEFSVIGEWDTFVGDFMAGEIPVSVAALVYAKGLLCAALFPLVILYKAVR